MPFSSERLTFKPAFFYAVAKFDSLVMEAVCIEAELSSERGSELLDQKHPFTSPGNVMSLNLHPNSPAGSWPQRLDPVSLLDLAC